MVVINVLSLTIHDIGLCTILSLTIHDNDQCTALLSMTIHDSNQLLLLSTINNSDHYTMPLTLKPTQVTTVALLKQYM